MLEGHSSGALGALLGLAVGAFNYVVALAAMGRATRVRHEDDEAAPVFDISRRLRPIKLMLMVSSFLVFPFVGYVAGAMLAPGGEAR